MAGIDIRKLGSTSQQAKAAEGREEVSVFDLLNKEISLFPKKLNDRKKERFYFELGILVSAGVDIETALGLIVDQQRKKQDKEIFEKIKAEVLSHGNLAKAFERVKVFSVYEQVSIEMGQESGRLSEVLNELALYYGRTIKQKRQLVNAFSYPLIVLAASVGTVFFMMKFIVPLFSDFFKRLGGELPAITKMVIRFSDWLSHYGFYIFVLTLAVIGSIYVQRSRPWFRKWSSKFILGTPVFGEVIRKTYLARLSSSMSMLLSAKIHTAQALELVGRMIDFHPVKDSLSRAREEYMKGVPLHDCLAKYKFYPPQMLSLIKVAEEVNRLDMVFSKLSGQYFEEVEQQTQLMGSLIQPALLLLIGGFVAIILIAMYLPMFQFGTSLH
ncbi:MAG TPA: type II secretion system F family protein [Bacteroidia bacterium]|jgi:type IV pilus assembly protein PilC